MNFEKFVKRPSGFLGPEVPDVPEIYQIEVARVCNLKCVMCPIHTHGFFPRKDETPLISIDLVKKIVDEGSLEASYFVELQMSGEPLLHPRLSQIIDIVKSTGVIVGLSTNGVFIDRQIEALSKLNYITFSLDSLDAYNEIRYGSKKEGFNLVEGIKKFLPIAAENNIAIDVQLVELIGWEEQLKKVKDVFEGDKVNIRTVENGYFLHFFPDLNNPISDMCINPWVSASIQCTGEVTSCCFSMGDDIMFGNLHEKTLKEIWNGPEVRRLRHEHRTGKYREICKKCYRRSPYLFHWKLYINALKNKGLV